MRMVALILLAKLFFKELLISLAILTKLTITSTNKFFFFFFVQRKILVIAYLTMKVKILAWVNFDFIF